MALHGAAVRACHVSVRAPYGNVRSGMTRRDLDGV